MIKTVVFVEGQTELIFVRELLLKVFQYQDIKLDCYELFSKTERKTDFPFSDPNASYYFQIVNVGNDNSVLSRMLAREGRLKESGFKRIIGLRDMYSERYRKNCSKPQTIDKDLNNRFLDEHRKQIKSDDMFISFAIMEIEAWLLAFRNSLERMNPKLTRYFIQEQLNIDLEETDPEETFFQPTKILDSIFRLVGMEYKKEKGEINSIVGYIERDDYFQLMEGGKCNSFKEFYNYLQLPFLN